MEPDNHLKCQKVTIYFGLGIKNVLKKNKCPSRLLATHLASEVSVKQDAVKQFEQKESFLYKQKNSEFVTGSFFFM